VQLLPLLLLLGCWLWLVVLKEGNLPLMLLECWLFLVV
jgi:hypothetical protein